jgi:hypothetical protein
MGEEVKETQMEWPPSKAFLIAFMPLLLLLATIPKLYTIYERRQIRKEPAFAAGTISRFETGQTRYRKRVYRVEVRYLINGKSFTEKCRAFHSLTEWQLHSLLEKQLPVIYEKDDPSNGVVLSTEEQFGHFGFTFPDSLIWTRQYFY